MPRARVISTVVLGLYCMGALGQTDYGFEYFNTVGRLIGEVKGIPWTAEICANAFPTEKASIEAALSEWSIRNREASDTLDAQFEVIQAYWKSLPERDRRGAQYKQEMLDHLNAQRPALRRSLESGDPAYFKKVCSAYAQALNSKRLDVEARWPTQMAIIRKGPR